MPGLRRLGLGEVASELMDVKTFPPAPGQGAITVESRIGDQRIDALLAPLNHRPTSTALVCERAFLAGLDGSCRTPIAGLATVSGDRLQFHGMVLLPDGSEVHEVTGEGTLSDAMDIGRDAALRVRKAGRRAFLHGLGLDDAYGFGHTASAWRDQNAERLLCSGFLPLVLPLTEIVSLPVKHPSGTFHAVAVTSASALRQAPDQALEPLLKLPCFVVGETTAAAARARGFETVTTGDGDGSSLAQTVSRGTLHEASYSLFDGACSSAGFRVCIAKADVHFRTMKTYDTVSVSYTTDFLVKFFNAGRVDCCLLYSHWGAEEFRRLIGGRKSLIILIIHLFFAFRPE